MGRWAHGAGADDGRLSRSRRSNTGPPRAGFREAYVKTAGGPLPGSSSQTTKQDSA